VNRTLNLNTDLTNAGVGSNKRINKILGTKFKQDLSLVIPAQILTRVLQHMTRTHLTLQPAERIATIPAPKPGQQYVLYAHVPFCESLCPYCSFNRFLYQEERTRQYFDSLRQEMRMVAALGYDFPSLYIGGGTPTIHMEELIATIDLARSLFSIREVSCETNPNHLTPEIMEQLRGRVDRLSVGVQSFNDELLKQMARYKKFGSGEEILARIQQVAGHGISINVDMIFNFPSQTEEILRKDIEMVTASGAEQCTFYPLMSAPSVERAMRRTIGTVDHSREAAYYQIINEELATAFEPMSAWTYSRKGGGMLDEYIVDYEEYVGIGSGSFSYLNGDLYVNTFSLKQYEEWVAAGRSPLAAMRKFNLIERMQYRFMMELFDLKLNKSRFKKDFGLPLWLGLWKEMAFMRLVGAFGSEDRSSILLTPRSRYLLVVMMREFFAGVNIIRDQARQALEPSERLMCHVSEQGSS